MTRRPVPEVITRAVNDPRHRVANLSATTIGLAALLGFAIRENAYPAAAVYCLSGLLALLPNPYDRAGTLAAVAGFGLACVNGQWMTAVMIAAIGVTRYVSAYLAVRADPAARAAFNDYIHPEREADGD